MALLALSLISVAALKAAAASQLDPCISAVSWSEKRLDLFGVSQDATIWHKFYTGYDWQPAGKFEQIPANAAACPSVTSWEEGRFDILYINGSGSHGGNVMHKYYAGGDWGPSWDTSRNIGGHDVLSLASTSWDFDRLDVVARVENGSFIHKAWTGDSWYPSLKGWENFGGTFFSDPAVVSWGPGRLDIVGYGAETASLLHKYWNHDSWSEWEDLGGGPFVGNPVATSWGENRLDFWAINSDGELNHKFWDGHQYSDWEILGGEFTDTPQVVHWKPNHIDIVGKSLSDDVFRSKSWDGSEWHGWNKLAGPFDSEPSITTRHDRNFLYVVGIGGKDDLRIQVWSGSRWEPATHGTWPLGRLTHPDAIDTWGQNNDQMVLGNLEL